MLTNIDEEENLSRMQRGDLYSAFSPQLVAARRRCGQAVGRLNRAGDLTRREIAEHWKDITNSGQPLPAPGVTEDEEDAILHEYPWIERPINIDYGYNVKVGSNVFINFNCTFIDTCTISIGSRTLVGPNVSFLSGTHPLDGHVRNGTSGPELGKPILIGEDCWLAAGVTILPGVTIGKGCTVGASSVVTKDVPDYHVVAGNPARIIKKLEPPPSDPAKTI
ncbi:acetyltransferase [Colletotrichum tofieldiae]|uniref:Acetyltransferase n=1 Tax=Colletotrichum tofieldiae TaxID=708197 RepID=A0A166VWZ8_9PEZI|nr:acetyltransferase [Colletotrichum tofieldiae]